MKRILVIGSDGYCGWPIVLRLLNDTEYVVVGVDNGKRREWVTECNSDTILNINSENDREEFLKDVFDSRFNYLQRDFTKAESVYDILRLFCPDVILNLAAQPSAPYSSISLHHCNYTQENNNTILRNLLWALHDLKMDNTHLVVTTTTGIYGAPDFTIPEGNIIFNKKEVPFPSMGGSWYHMSRAFDSSNMRLAAKEFGLMMSEMRTSIVCGSSTEETRYFGNNTRFDIDFYFGVVLNRFVAMALAGKPLTIYGRGSQRKPLISLEEMCQSMVNICEVKERDIKYEIYNQTNEVVSITELAEMVKKFVESNSDIKVNITHISNPGKEDEEHQMVISNDKFLLLLGDFRYSIERSVERMCLDLIPYKAKLIEYFSKHEI